MAAGVLAARTPSGDRPWSADHAVLPEITIAGDSAVIRHVRNFEWTAVDRFTPSYDDRRYDLDRIESAWLVLTPFSRAWRGPAHSFVSFGFADSQFLAISIEARREAGEAYGVFAGLVRRFELIYVVGDEHDLIGRRARFDGFDVYVYPIRAPRDRIRRLLLEMLARAQRLATRPEFYNTLTNSCVSNLVWHVNAISPGRIPTGLKVVFPGYADEVALRLGLIAANGDIAAARARYRVNDRARRYWDDARFSLRIREVSADR